MKVAAAVANRLLGHDRWAHHQLRSQAGKVARVRFGPVAGDFRIGDDGHLLAVAAARPDAVIRVPLRSVLDALEHPDQAAMTIAVEGDQTLGSALVNFARVAPWLAETELARFVGPVLAARLTAAARAAIRVPRYAADRMGSNARGYFRDEVSSVVRRAELERHHDEVSELAGRADGLVTRVEALSAALERRGDLRADSAAATRQ